jgi:hypothetical protein
MLVPYNEEAETGEHFYRFKAKVDTGHTSDKTAMLNLVILTRILTSALISVNHYS